MMSYDFFEICMQLMICKMSRNLGSKTKSPSPGNKTVFLFLLHISIPKSYNIIYGVPCELTLFILFSLPNKFNNYYLDRLSHKARLHMHVFISRLWAVFLEILLANQKPSIPFTAWPLFLKGIHATLIFCLIAILWIARRRLSPVPITLSLLF